jgi:UDP-N-acetylglucosamine 2-epimerase (non-hydrolysing)
VERAACIAYVFGARPNFVKTAPVVRALAARLPTARHVIIHTGQHYDKAMSDVFLDELELPAPDYALGVGSGTHAAQTARALVGIEAALTAEKPALVVVPGDVNSTLAGALAAAKLGIPIAHIEAGLRSFDRSMPEEINRVLVDQLSQFCFTHSPEASENLRSEGIDASRIVFVGNTMIDTLVRLRSQFAASSVLDRLGLEPRTYALVTLHRPKLVDGPLLEDALLALSALARSMPVVFPVHPRTRDRLRKFPPVDGLILVEPLGYLDFLALESNAAVVVTDSGGVQEETTYLRVPCFTIRDSTERPITVTAGTNRLMGQDPRAIAAIPELLRNVVIPHRPPEGWDGLASARLAEVVASWLEGTVELETPRSIAGGAR